MLTADLVGVRRRGGELRLIPVDPGRRARIETLAATFSGIARGHVGSTRAQLDDAFDQAEADADTPAPDRRLIAAVRKLIADGGYGAVVTSKVLNEGVDIPDASVAIVVSGSASVREHVQRLGRVLRAREGKRAVLYELVTAGTTETFTSARRRDHSAYR